MSRLVLLSGLALLAPGCVVEDSPCDGCASAVTGPPDDDTGRPPSSDPDPTEPDPPETNDPTDPTDPGDPTGLTDSGPFDTADPCGDAPSHALDIQPIWDATCGGCHLDGSNSGGLNLDDGHATLVGVPSADVPSLERVQPGDEEASYLWLKLVDTHLSVGGAGGQMPLNRPQLSDDRLVRIRRWIRAGACP